MMNTATNMSALEWFFRRPSASNFPQSNSSTELKQLCNAVTMLSNALGSLDTETANFANLTTLAQPLSDWVSRVMSSEERIEKNEIDDLIGKVEEIISIYGKLSSTHHLEAIKSGINSTIIALVILAKISHDVAFRNRVIELANAFSPA